MNGGQRRGQPGEDCYQNGQDLSQVAGKQIVDELADIGVDHPSMFNRGDNAGIVVVGEHHVGSFFGHVGPGDAHGDSNVGSLEGRGVVDSVAGHRHDLVVALQGIHNPHFVFR